MKQLNDLVFKQSNKNKFIKREDSKTKYTQLLEKKKSEAIREEKQ